MATRGLEELPERVERVEQKLDNLAATVDAALARHYSVLVPLVIASGICFLITLSILIWWRPTSGKRTSSGYVRPAKDR